MLKALFFVVVTPAYMFCSLLSKKHNRNFKILISTAGILYLFFIFIFLPGIYFNINGKNMMRVAVSKHALREMGKVMRMYHSDNSSFPAELDGKIIQKEDENWFQVVNAIGMYTNVTIVFHEFLREEAIFQVAKENYQIGIRAKDDDHTYLSTSPIDGKEGKYNIFLIGGITLYFLANIAYIVFYFAVLRKKR